MVQIWQMDAYPFGDPRLPHHCFPPKNLSPDELTKRTGALYYKLDADDQVATAKRIGTMKVERNFTREDMLTLDAQSTLDFEEKVKELFEESELEEDTARMVLEGSAYFDMESDDGNWVRVMLEHGDLLVIPKGITHRMTTTPKNFVKIRRYFKDDSDQEN